ncbi:hypothetical protein ELQ92_15240 [Labedella populi]|uniref:Uncharacterized protein n=1 Tax=Labedella populi TaxID=2498850 RepID=A0A3S4AAT7_9MICO|nr:hypothetical protein ELQ92_15240 [Labedella populi]
MPRQVTSLIDTDTDIDPRRSPHELHPSPHPRASDRRTTDDLLGRLRRPAALREHEVLADAGGIRG